MKNDVRLLRTIAALTQEELAMKVGVTRQTIISIEGGRYDPSLELALRLGRILGKPIESIFHLEG